MAKTLRTITVGQLRDLLDGEPDDARVIFTSDYGDYHHTDQALPIRGEVQEAQIKESAYSNSGWAIVSFDSDEDDAPEPLKDMDGTYYHAPDDGQKFLVIF